MEIPQNRLSNPAQPPQSASQKSKAQTDIPSWLPACILIVAILGLADAGYLGIEHLKGNVPPCTIIKGCEIVTTSRFSEIFNIPVALFGALYYVSVATIMIAWFDRKNPLLLKIVSLYSIAGLLASAWFVYLQLFVLKAICMYCMGSAISSTAIFVLGMIYIKKYE